ncbi:spermidine/putrescine ABC transporter ATP-binding protein [Adlercreutzia equolifaciens subsp. celatus]|uniref:ABC-type quaternary amine transporter n=3 Tax=Adlercreutzia equolifaciens TaxID=446660 RepID=A0A3N0ARP3_9ACTN|nr:ABC transporter ATP-binding protein [Adlercreutzia equolifaciens]MCP2076703.1 iron(III) transport system ATP-binding protein [Adlercreutzia equolifaciens subsp. celatus DSM 18785]RNL37495.1 ABC transporter [Adlercreutzia equolifaciens subsp. celatus DSM 18785]BCS57148.1 spermidine/putrescine ABC transporter ATP-binding protein [Adlercreutzia equolifaciens subsp. celatus]
MELTVRHIDLSMGEGKRARTVLSDVSFSVPDGAFCSLLGESGAGKSTILKVIAGILLQDGGSVLFDGAPVDGLPAHRRGLGFVFQDVRLFPHMTVEENVAYPLRMAGAGKRERLARAGELLERVQLPGFGPRRVQTLSGGQAQRVALARAIAAAPAALLLDEPFSGLDESLRDDMRSLLLRLHREDGLTVLMVTHDANEAIMMSDRIVALDGGHISQIGTPEELYRRPATAKIAACFGDCSVLKGCVESERFILDGIVLPALGIGDGPAVAVVRQGDCLLSPVGEGHGTVPAGEAVVRCGVYAGAGYLTRLDVAGQTLTVPTASLPDPGEIVPVRIDGKGCFVFSA